MVSQSSRQGEVTELYSAAHAAHYEDKDLLTALGLYRKLIVAHPDETEAQYSRSQIQNIANAVVPKPDLFEAQVRLALGYMNSLDEEISSTK